MPTIAVVSPGAMGSALGRCWAAGGHRVVATVTGRSSRTAALATGLELLPDLDAVVAAADVVVSVCPPDQAETVLAAVLRSAVRRDVRPLLVDANALAPQTVSALEATAGEAGLELVDGAVSGGPPEPHAPTPGTSDHSTMLYLSGPAAGRVEALPRVGFRVRVVGPEVGQASGVKMCTASVYKGTTAVWLQALQTAAALGVTDLVLADLRESDPGRVDAAARSLASAASKSARFVAEMEQISVTQEGAGASPELFSGMAAVYRRVSGTALAAMTPEQAAEQDDLGAVLAALARDGR